MKIAPSSSLKIRYGKVINILHDIAIIEFSPGSKCDDGKIEIDICIFALHIDQMVFYFGKGVID